MKKLRRWLHQVWKAGRNPILEDICANLRLWGIDSDVSPTSRWEPVTHNTESRAIGMVTIRRGPVKWVNYRTESITDGENAGLSVALLDFGIPDSRLRQQSRTGSSYFYIESIKVRKIPWVGRVIEFSWKGNELGLGIVDRLSSDEEVNSSLMTGFASWGDVQIRAFKGLWTISMLGKL